MPWPALDYGKNRSNKSLTKYAGSGIPDLVFVDADGKVLSDSFVGGNYVGPNKVLQDIEKTLKANPGTAAAPSGDAPAKAPLSGASKSTQGSKFDDFFKKK